MKDIILNKFAKDARSKSPVFAVAGANRTRVTGGQRKRNKKY